ncbi:polysaccharide export protein [Shewanella maritima]|uniref:Polysaccharide export protein n=1 Tax=Shewanella maritima TaxID=2520507 RepID=A0A411PL14_9GAMM|nr:polysaccharide biosynthesis/export family protein [Shewanella maritima]QBF84227.1 polysaccharide export protein [Shewanella maritima]
MSLFNPLTKSLFKPTLTIFVCMGLTACVTPMVPTQNNICEADDQSATHMTVANSQVNTAHSSNCHYFGQHTPYLRTQSAQTDKLIAPFESAKTTDLPVTVVTTNSQTSQTLTLSAGDKIDIKILNGEDFSQAVEVDADGFIYLPYLPAIKAKDLSIAELNQAIKQTLINEDMMRAHAIRISILPISWAPINIISSGALFEPGQHMINKKLPVENIDDGSNYSGDLASNRSIAAALKSSGGVRPDADLSRVTVTRDDKVFLLDLSGILSGEQTQEFMLVSGDRIHVPSTYRFDDKLVRPSQITPPGIRVFISNLTQPASSNSQSAVDREATRFPYGTRLLNGAIAANCVGGAQSTNASRYVILVTKNPLSDELDVVERSIDDLIRNAWQPNFNPVLLPGDGLACYDSRITNGREIFRSITDVVIPSSLLGWL